MRKFLIATHGTLASGIQNALRIITGEIDRVMVIDAFAGPENPFDQIQIYFDQLNDQDEVIILTDLPGGSVNQMLIRYVKRPQTHLVSGVNLSLVLALILDPGEMDTCSLIRQAIPEARQQMLYINEKGEQMSAELNAFF
ncbi:PTS sugar transporter subunit IIA [Holdemania filiformis]|uniref:PTS sugar transporter subunit IIA n=1 Tax=Holdemania filiformis TaxID=61171 RepID=UPI00266F9C3B|nr:hypothetical protein [Holdemania filiformis]